MFNLKSLHLPLAAAALVFAPMMATANQNNDNNNDRKEDATLVRFCQFDAPDQADDCSAEIVKCDFRDRDQDDHTRPMSERNRDNRDRDDRNRDRDCRDSLKITCGQDKIFKGPYTQDFDDGEVRVTAGKHPQPGAPEIIHDIFRHFPGKADAKLILGDMSLEGTCRAKIIR